jgi:hypothetical protein
MPTAFCSLDDAYGNWNDRKKTIYNNKQESKESKESKENVQKDLTEIDNKDDRTFCPNCKSCLKSNDILQQNIIDQIVWPRPRWIPQNPEAYFQYDPYNRYWANFNQREDFGNVYNNDQISMLLYLVIFILFVIFITQVIELIFKEKKIG